MQGMNHNELFYGSISLLVLTEETKSLPLCSS